MQYFCFGFIYGIVGRKSVGSDILFADIWIYYGSPFDFAGIFERGRSMAGYSHCGAAYTDTDGMPDIYAAQVLPLFMKDGYPFLPLYATMCLT